MISLRANIAWAFAGNTVYAACQWAMLMIVVKLSAPESAGAFALAFAITAPVMMLANLQLRALQATDATRQFVFGHYFALRLVTASAALVACMSIGYFSMGSRHRAVLGTIALAKAAESMSDVVYGALQQREQMKTIAISLIVKGICSVAVLGAMLYITRSIEVACCGLACAWVAVLVLYDMRAVRMLLAGSDTSLRPVWSTTALSSLARQALPLGLVMGVMSVQVNVPRYLVGHAAGIAGVGVFSAISSVAVVGSTICNAMGQAASPRLAAHFAASNVAFWTVLGKLVAIACAIGAAGVTFAATLGGRILVLLFRPEYERFQDVFLMLMIAAGISYAGTLLGYGLTASRRLHCQVPMVIASLAATLGACLWLTPSGGLRGAAVACVVGAVVQTAGAALGLAWPRGARMAMDGVWGRRAA